MEPICGVDEVGRGPIAGPVVACAVILLDGVEGLADSKALTAKRRQELAQKLKNPCVARLALGAASVVEIDRLNIRQATFLAMRRAVAALPLAMSTRLLIDGRDNPDLGWPSQAIIGGDGKVDAIAAASIVAKVTRDRLMARLATRFPPYGWESNAGYPTKAHRDALISHGITAHHRRSFAPVRACLAA